MPGSTAWWSRVPPEATGQPVRRLPPLFLTEPIERARARIPEALFLAVTTAAGLWAGGRWLNPIGDSGVWWSIADRLNHGERLYRDVYLQYGPLSPYLLAMAMRLFGASARVFLLLNWIPGILAGVVLLRLAERFLRPIERLAVVGLVIGMAVLAPGGRLVYPYCPAAVHALVFSAAALLFFSRRDGLLSGVARAGILAGLAFCAKQEIGLAALASLLAACVLSGRGCLRPIGRLLAGFGVVAAAGAAFVFSSAPIASLRWQSHVWPLKLGLTKPWVDLSLLATGTSRPGWGELVAFSGWILLGFVLLVAAASLFAAGERRLPRWRPVLALAGVFVLWWVLEGAFLGAPPFLPLCLSAGAAFLVAGLAATDRRLPDRESLVAIGLFAGLTGMRTAFSIDAGSPFAGPAHFAEALTWVLLLCALVPRRLVPNEPAATYARAALALALLFVGARSAVAGFRALEPASVVSVATRQGEVYLPRERAPFFRRVGESVVAGERALVLPEINGVDVLFGVRSVSPYPAHMPGLLDADAERALVSRLSANPPDIVVIFERPVWEFGVAPLGRGFGAGLVEWISRHDRIVDRSAGGTIWRR